MVENWTERVAKLEETLQRYRSDLEYLHASAFALEHVVNQLMTMEMIRNPEFAAYARRDLDTTLGLYAEARDTNPQILTEARTVVLGMISYAEDVAKTAK